MRHEGREFQVGEEIMLSRPDFFRYAVLGMCADAGGYGRRFSYPVKVSIITLLYNTTAEEFTRYTETLIASTQGSPLDLEVIIVENTGAEYPDRVHNRELALSHGFVYIAAEKNLGFANGVNWGAEHATGDVLVFMNDDAFFPEPFLDTLVGPLINEPKVAVCGATLEDENGKSWASYDRPDWVCGACFAVRRWQWELCGGFDRRYFFSWEETDYCQLWARMGYEIRKTGAKVVHTGGETVVLSDFSRLWLGRGGEIYAQKWTKTDRIVGSMLVGNEAGRYLEESIEWLLPRTSVIVIVDDGSTDGTQQILEDYAARYPDKIRLYRHATSIFKEDEHLARESLHFKALKENPAFIIPLDADEELSMRFDKVLPELMKSKEVAFNFPIIHLFEDDSHRRVDSLWGKQANIRFYRVLWREPQEFMASPLHCGSCPAYAYRLKFDRDDVALVHKGWIRAEDFERKKKRNLEVDPYGYMEPQSHWESAPHLKVWRDDSSVTNWKI